MLLYGTVTCTFFDAFEFFDDIHALDDFTEYRVVHVQPRSCCCSDEKLATVGARTRVSHGENACFVELQITGAFVFEVFAPYRLTSAACSGGVASLYHKFFNDTVKDDAIVVSILAVRSEVFTGFGCKVGKEVERDRALGGFECDFHNL